MKARNLWIALAFVTCVGLAFPTPTVAASPPTASTSALLPSSVASALALAPDIDINITKTERDEWYKNPVVVGMGVIILVLLVALASRGGGTTVIKE